MSDRGEISGGEVRIHFHNKEEESLRLTQNKSYGLLQVGEFTTVKQTAPAMCSVQWNFLKYNSFTSNRITHTHSAQELHSCRRKRLFIHHFLLFTQLIVQTTSAEGQGHNGQSI